MTRLSFLGIFVPPMIFLSEEGFKSYVQCFAGDLTILGIGGFVLTFS